MEESGVHLPVPGDVYVAYLGKLNAASISNLVLAWLGIIAVVVGGATNLYLISRRWAPALLRHRFVSEVLGVDEARLERGRRWSKRWGALAIIFGRPVPGATCRDSASRSQSSPQARASRTESLPRRWRFRLRSGPR